MLHIFVSAFAVAPVDSWRDLPDAMRGILTERGYSFESADLNGLPLDVFRRIPEASCADAIGRTRNLLGEEDCRRFLADIETEKRGEVCGSDRADPASGAFAIGTMRGIGGVMGGGGPS